MAQLAKLSESEIRTALKGLLTTHDAGGVTSKDVELAQKLEAIAHKLQ